MNLDMQQSASNRQAVEIVRARLRQGVKATPLCIAIMGWLGETMTTPYATAVVLRDGDVWVRLSNEDSPERVCSFLDFLSQVRVICVSLAMTETQTQQIVALARSRLS